MLIVLAGMLALGGMNISAGQEDSKIKFSKKEYIAPVCNIAVGGVVVALTPLFIWAIHDLEAKYRVLIGELSWLPAKSEKIAQSKTKERALVFFTLPCLLVSGGVLVYDGVKDIRKLRSKQKKLTEMANLK